MRTRPDSPRTAASVRIVAQCPPDKVWIIVCTSFISIPTVRFKWCFRQILSSFFLVANPFSGKTSGICSSLFQVIEVSPDKGCVWCTMTQRREANNNCLSSSAGHSSASNERIKSSELSFSRSINSAEVAKVTRTFIGWYQQRTQTVSRSNVQDTGFNTF